MSEKIKILYIDDYALDRELVKDALEKEHGGFQVTEASGKQDFEVLLQTHRFDVVLSDFNIAGFQGLQVLEAVHNHNPCLPVIIVTGTGSEEIAASALKLGASDYVIKRPKHILKLPQTILAAIERQNLIDQRRQARMSLKKSEKRYRSLFKNMLNGYFYCRMLFEKNKPIDFIYLDVNKAFETLTGLTNVIGKKVTEVIPGIREKDAELFDNISLVVSTGIPKTFEIYIEAMSKWFSFSVYSPQKEHFAAIIDNISERKTAEARLQESEERFRAIATSTPDHILVQDKNLRYIWVLNPQLGLTEKEMIGKTDFDFLHREDATILTELKMRVLGTGKHEFVKIPLTSPKGGVQHFEGAYIPKRDVHGTIDGLIGYLKNVTQRVEGERAIRQSEARYRTLVNTIPDLIWLKSPEGVYIGCNKSFEKFFGEAESEIIGKTDYDFKDQDFADLFRKHDQKAMEADGPSVNEEWLTFPDNSYHGLFETIKTPMRDADGKLIGVLGIARDITERWNAEAALRENEEKYRSLFEQSSDGIFLTVPDGTITDVNPSACRMLGMTKEEVCSAGRDAILEKDEALISNLKERERTGKFSGELTFIRKDGSKFIAETSSVIISRKPGARRAVAIVRDVTERKQAEKTLRDSETRYRTLVENIPQGVLLKDRDSNYLSVNQSYAALFGIQKDKVLGKSDYDFHPKYDADAFRMEDRLVMETGESKEFKEELVKEGKKRLLHKVKVPVRDSMGKVTGVLSTVSDVTDQVQMEEQLHHSQKMEAVGRLAGGVAHDFNNLLTVIGGYSDIALGKMPENDSVRENILEVQIAVNRASKLTRQLLAFSRRQVVEIRVVDLGAILREMEKMLHRLLGEDVKLITKISKTLGRVKADPGQIGQVLSNLAINARDAMPDGGTIEITADNFELSEASTLGESNLKPGRYVLVSVHDTGSGMDADLITRIFEPFFTTKEAGKGTGLGLSMVYGIVKQSGGEITVSSEPGRGTTFNIYLPQVEEVESTFIKEDEKTVLKGAETILIIEDEKSLRKLTATILQNQGYQVLEAPDGETAIREFEKHLGPIDLVLTDIVMPGKRGPAVVEKLKLIRKNFKVLYMSGYTDNEINHADMLRRGDHFIPKPFSPTSLVSKIRGVLDEDKR